MKDPQRDDPEPADPGAEPPRWGASGESATRESIAEARFLRDLYTRVPRLHVTIALLAANVAVYLAMVASGVHPLSPEIPAMIAWGASVGDRVLGDEPWRLFTSTFLHFGIVHLAMNLWVLWSLAQLVERAYGHAGYLVLYLASGLVASEASLFFSPFGVGAGASGAVFGVLGALVALLLRARRRIPAGIFRQLRGTVVSYLVLNVIFGAAIPSISMAAHTGGFVAGVLLGLILVPSAEERWPRGAREVVASAAGLVLIAVGWVAQPAPLNQVQGEYDHANAVWEEGRLRYNAALVELEDGRIEDGDLAASIRQGWLADWSAVRARLEAFEPVPRELEESFQDLIELARLRERALELQVISLESPNDEDAYLRARAAWNRVDRALDAYRE